MKRIDPIEEGLEDFEEEKWYANYPEWADDYYEDDNYGYFYLNDLSLAGIKIENDVVENVELYSETYIISIYVSSLYNGKIIGKITQRANPFNIRYSLPAGKNKRIKIYTTIYVSDESVVKIKGNWYIESELADMFAANSNMFAMSMANSNAAFYNIRENTLITYNINGMDMPPHLPMLIGNEIVNDVKVNQAIILQTVLFDRDYGALIRKMWKEGKIKQSAQLVEEY